MDSKLDPAKASAKTPAKTPAPWAGCDVGKLTFDAGLWTESETGRPRELKDIPVKTFQHTQEGVAQFIEWVVGRVGDAEFRVVMEATGKYSVELAAWMIALRPSLAPAVVNP